jgi:hypothetical protein
MTIWNYLALTVALFSAALALHALVTILRAASGKARWNSEFAVFAQAFYVAMFGTGAAAMFSLAFA